ncbi:MAG: recombinase family protein [Oscillospiraceae bacterium]|nr:recombinase family protein [Oscillospiraceae bacterium]
MTEIFSMAAEGRSPGEIAAHLNKKGVATPFEYRREGLVCLSPDRRRKSWSSSAVCKMLKNEVYIGSTVQGKTEKPSFKSGASRPKPRDEWIVVPGTHEPIVSVELFRLAGQRCVSRRSPPSAGFENLFSGVAVCARCGRNMSSAPGDKGGSHRLCCGGYKSRGASECDNHFIDYELLYSAVSEELRKLFTLSDRQKAEIAAKLRQLQDSDTDTDPAKEITHLKERREDTVSLIKKLYGDYSSGAVSTHIYNTLAREYEAELNSLERSIAELMKPSVPAPTANADLGVLSAAEALFSAQNLSKPLIRAFIERIEVEQGYYITDEKGQRRKLQRARIYYRFSSPESG